MGKPYTINDLFNDAEPTHKELSSSVSRTATLDTPMQENVYARGVTVLMKINSADSSATVTGLNIQARLGSSGGTYVSFLAGSSFAPTTGGENRKYTVYPGGNASAVSGALDGIAGLPPFWRAQVVHGTTRAIDYSLHAFRIP